MMFLLNNNMIEKYIEKGLLAIDPMDRNLLRPTSVYFRLGRHCKVWNANTEKYDSVDLEEPATRELVLPPRGMATVFSKEHFRCSEQVMGILGPASQPLLANGIVPILSPSIDPTFSGALEFVLQNLLDEPRRLPYQTPIGKVIFFDVRDTYPVQDNWYGNDDQTRRRRDEADNPLSPEDYRAVVDNFRQL